jgi:hypothetical protein
MTLTIHLSADAEKQLHERAAQSGQNVEEYVLQLVESHLRGANGDSARPGAKGFSKLLAPVHEDFQKSGMTEGELDDLLRETLAEVRKEKREPKSDAS